MYINDTCFPCDIAHCPSVVVADVQCLKASCWSPPKTTTPPPPPPLPAHPLLLWCIALLVFIVIPVLVSIPVRRCCKRCRARRQLRRQQRLGEEEPTSNTIEDDEATIEDDEATIEDDEAVQPPQSLPPTRGQIIDGVRHAPRESFALGSSEEEEANGRGIILTPGSEAVQPPQSQSSIDWAEIEAARLAMRALSSPEREERQLAARATAEARLPWMRGRWTLPVRRAQTPRKARPVEPAASVELPTLEASPPIYTPPKK